MGEIVRNGISGCPVGLAHGVQQFLTDHGDTLGGFYAQPHLAIADPGDEHADMLTNANGLTTAAGKDEHRQALPMRPLGRSAPAIPLGV